MADSRLLARVRKVEAVGAGGVRAILWASRGQDAAAVEQAHVAGHPRDAGRTLVLAWQEVTPCLA